MELPATLPKLSFAGGTLVLEGISREGVVRAFGPAAWVWDRRVGAWRSDAIQYVAVRERLREVFGPIDDSVASWGPVRWPRIDIHRPRDEQNAAVAAWTGPRRGCIVMPTGTGKTEVALTIMVQTATSTLVVAPVRDLMYQWHRRILAGLGYGAGIIGDNVFRVLPVAVTTYDSACIHMDKLGNRFGLIVFDECHHLPGSVRGDAARMCAAPMRMGLTATPERSDGRHVDLTRLIGPTVYEMPISAAKGRTLADYEVVRIPIHLSAEEQTRYNQLSREIRHFMAEQRKTTPEFTWEDLCAQSGRSAEARRALKAYFAKKSIEDRAEEKLRVLEDLFRLHVGEPCLVFAGSNWAKEDFKTILRHAKLARLMHTIVRDGNGQYRLHFDGPASVLRQTRRYGAAMARFLPALVACDGWRMHAMIRTRRRGWNVSLDLSSEDGLSSHLPAPRAFDSNLEQVFAEKWGPDSRNGWTIVREGEILRHGQKVFVPDFVFQHDDGRSVLMEIIGFWTPEYIQAKVRTLRLFANHRTLLAVAAVAQSAVAELPHETIPFKSTLLIKDVLNRLEDASR